ncbi:hypothetical protein [Microseira sp. BLCC-F43]|uniref:hypothetical protein n=1 Tax=Microseira sp. BLCC-F43 TaxID=3153602 RepID=UPI0035B6D371
MEEARAVPRSGQRREESQVKKDGCRCVEATLCERQPAPILALAQFDQRTGIWGNSCLAVQKMPEKSEVGKVAAKVMLPSRSPP